MRELTLAEVTSLLERPDELLAVWPDASGDRLDTVVARHLERTGFRFVAEHDDEERLAGFAYGYEGAAGQWWHDRVASALDEEARARWLAPGHFELVELAVRPDLRRRGLGVALHDALLARVDAPTAVLSTQVDNEPAIALYRGRGWRVIVPGIDFGREHPAFLVMGRELAEVTPS